MGWISHTTGIFGRSSVGTLLARTPFVVKLTADPAYERARRWGLFRGSLEEFQAGAPPSTVALRVLRDAEAKRAAHVVTPSAYLRELAIGWGVPPERTTVSAIDAMASRAHGVVTFAATAAPAHAMAAPNAPSTRTSAAVKMPNVRNHCRFVFAS